MGEITEPYFDLLRMPRRVLRKEHVSEDVAAITAEVERAKRPGALIVPEGVLDASR
jgi:hypothetical protein